ncbi:1-deoxy-D-xylulose-5-phosphate reductoisomerase [Undibacterium sp. TJN25]|uniref:1-deoxy-D-xylulose-5-phosphate reductoisomerase n=1 Tax=Undibacterium sp. TJN25 TaxID=3413056 RepID=UPI003BF11C94
MSIDQQRKQVPGTQQLSILGSTGSVGVSTLDVVVRHPDRYRVYALTAHTQVQKLALQCEQFRPEVAVVGSAAAAAELQTLLREKKIATQVEHGPEALCKVASASGCDTVMAAIVGAAGLASSLAAAQAGKKVLLANKEALVMSGQLFINAIIENGATLLPIDSEHNAIFQCLPRDYQRQPDRHGVRRIVLTASGGPFLNRDVESLTNVTPDEAVAHPNWVMGRKISVDSATMMNKGLEVIEAHWLFATPAEQIEVVIHPQSVIHSMVSYADGSMLAQLGNPDMRTPIAYGLAYPDRIDSGVAPLDLTQIAKLSFEAPDLKRFPCLALAFDALKTGRSAPTILNASNEIAVQAFLDGKIGFRMIDQIIARTLDKVAVTDIQDLAGILEQDRIARATAEAFIAS